MSGNFYKLFIFLLFVMTSCTSENSKKEESIIENNSIRVITLSPHLAEMLFNLGALNTLVGVSAYTCLLYTSPSPRDRTRSRMPSSA